MAPDVSLQPAGGGGDGAVGTSAESIARAIQAADSGAGVLVLMDLGSAVLNSELALEMLDDQSQRRRVRLSDAPLVEGAVFAAVAASGGAPLEMVAAAAIDGKSAPKDISAQEAN